MPFPERGSDNGYPNVWYDEPPQGGSSSSGAVVIRDVDCLAVGTCDVGCGRSSSSESSSGIEFLLDSDLVGEFDYFIWRKFRLLEHSVAEAGLSTEECLSLTINRGSSPK